MARLALGYSASSARLVARSFEGRSGVRLWIVETINAVANTRLNTVFDSAAQARAWLDSGCWLPTHLAVSDLAYSRRRDTAGRHFLRHGWRRSE